jgi:hypothetical protein
MLVCKKEYEDKYLTRNCFDDENWFKNLANFR